MLVFKLVSEMAGKLGAIIVDSSAMGTDETAAALEQKIQTGEFCLAYWL